MDLPNRKLPRLSGYDYATSNYYFVTVCTHEKTCIFGEPDRLNLLGKLAENILLKTPEHFPCVQIDKYVVMPNHVHAIVTVGCDGTAEAAANLSTVIGSYKSAVTREVHARFPEITVWQKSFYDHIIRSETAYQEIWQYIDDNPRKWMEDELYFP